MNTFINLGVLTRLDYYIQSWEGYFMKVIYYILLVTYMKN